MKYYKNKKICSTRGVTLIELLLYISISVTLLSTISGSLIMMLQSRIKSQTIAEVEQQGMHVMRLITQTLRNAEEITSPTIGNSSASLILQVANIASSPTVFDLSGGEMRVKGGAGTAAALTNSHITVSDLTFNNVSYEGTPGIVQVLFTVTHVNPIGRSEYAFNKTFQTSAALRYPQ